MKWQCKSARVLAVADVCGDWPHPKTIVQRVACFVSHQPSATCSLTRPMLHAHWLTFLCSNTRKHNSVWFFQLYCLTFVSLLMSRIYLPLFTSTSALCVSFRVICLNETNVVSSNYALSESGGTLYRTDITIVKMEYRLEMLHSDCDPVKFKGTMLCIQTSNSSWMSCVRGVTLQRYEACIILLKVNVFELFKIINF